MVDSVVQRGGDGGDPNDPSAKKSRRIQDLWDDNPLTSGGAADGVPIAGAGKTPKLKPLSHYVPERVMTVIRYTEVLVATIIETLALAAVVTFLARFGFKTYFTFDLYSAQSWAALRDFYLAGNVIPWGFVFSLGVMGLFIMYSLYRIYVFNISGKHEHAERALRIIFYPIRLVLRLIFAFFASLKKKPSRRPPTPPSSGQKNQSEPDWGESPEGEEPDLKVEPDGGLNQVHTSFQSEAMDSQLVSSQKGRGSK